MALSNDAVRYLTAGLANSAVANEIITLLNGTNAVANTFSGANTFTGGITVTTTASTITGGLTISTTALTITDVNVVLSATTGTKIGTATGQKLGFWNATPVVQQVLATGGGATADNIITVLQTLGLCKQS